MNGKQKLLVAGDYGASDESDNEDAQPINEPRKNEVTNIAQGRLVIEILKFRLISSMIYWGF